VKEGEKGRGIEKGRKGETSKVPYIPRSLSKGMRRGRKKEEKAAGERKKEKKKGSREPRPFL